MSTDFLFSVVVFILVHKGSSSKSLDINPAFSKENLRKEWGSLEGGKWLSHPAQRQRAWELENNEQ